MLYGYSMCAGRRIARLTNLYQPVGRNLSFGPRSATTKNVDGRDQRWNRTIETLALAGQLHRLLPLNDNGGIVFLPFNYPLVSSGRH